MKKIRNVIACIYCAMACFFMNITAFAEEAEQYTEADRLIFGIFPIWLFMLIIAGAVMLAIIVIIEVFKKKNK
ncbi:MAG: hypothetical protein IJY73_07090 [Oscillospiraceae bacterium]|nr:hypothetical protein [Oscillospiraceae bacterium]